MDSGVMDSVGMDIVKREDDSVSAGSLADVPPKNQAPGWGLPEARLNVDYVRVAPPPLLPNAKGRRESRTLFYCKLPGCVKPGHAWNRSTHFNAHLASHQPGVAKHIYKQHKIGRKGNLLVGKPVREITEKEKLWTANNRGGNFLWRWKEKKDNVARRIRTGVVGEYFGQKSQSMRSGSSPRIPQLFGPLLVNLIDCIRFDALVPSWKQLEDVDFMQFVVKLIESFREEKGRNLLAKLCRVAKQKTDKELANLPMTYLEEHKIDLQMKMEGRLEAISAIQQLFGLNDIDGDGNVDSRRTLTKDQGLEIEQAILWFTECHKYYQHQEQTRDPANWIHARVIKLFNEWRQGDEARETKKQQVIQGLAYRQRKFPDEDQESAMKLGNFEGKSEDRSDDEECQASFDVFDLEKDQNQWMKVNNVDSKAAMVVVPTNDDEDGVQIGPPRASVTSVSKIYIPLYDRGIAKRPLWEEKWEKYKEEHGL